MASAAPHMVAMSRSTLNPKPAAPKAKPFRVIVVFVLGAILARSLLTAVTLF